MNVSTPLVVFKLDEQRYALELGAVERIVGAVEITSLPNAPATVLGVINVAGRLLPVFNLRRRFNLPIRDIRPADHFVIARTAVRSVVLVVDEVQEVATHNDIKVTPSEQLIPGFEGIHGIAKLGDGLVLIYDLEKFLSSEESQVLEAALSSKERSG